jgi:predicted lipoprotein with Yx(FWY)xxD motif
MDPAEALLRRGLGLLALVTLIALPTYVTYTKLGHDGPRPGVDQDAAGASTAGPAPPSPSASLTGPATPSGTASASAPKGFTTRSLKSKNIEHMGTVVVDSDGWTLYRYDRDASNPPASACLDAACLRAWQPILANGDLALFGIDRAKVGSITRPDGGRQVTLGGSPLYGFKRDGGPSRWNGQALGNTWWVVQANGDRNLTCLPPGAVPP